MWLKKIFILFSLLLLTSQSAFSQQTPAKTDTTVLYKNIESYSKRSLFTRFIYALVFKPQLKNLKRMRKYKNPIQKPYSGFEGKIIRNINIETLDPFGFSISDTLSPEQTFLKKTGNKLHIKTKQITIRNLLLIHPNQKFDSLLVNESERLLRGRSYVKDVSFFVKATSKKSDSVDVFIREMDNWSLIPEVASSITSNTILFTEKNFVGAGHEFSNSYTKDFKNGTNAYLTNYSIPNIRNTYISTTLHYEIDGHKNFNKSLTIERPFYSSFAKWAGGVSFASQFRKGIWMDSLSVYTPTNLYFNTQDYWAGYALRIFKGNTVEARTTHLITTLRFLRVRYLERPFNVENAQNPYSNEHFYLAGIGISAQNYVQDKYVFKFGVTEFVPIGKVVALTGGYQLNNGFKRLYLGARVSAGGFYPWGYLSSNFEYETFFSKSKSEQGVFTADVNYFTKLFEIGKWKFRQFVKPEFEIGIHRFAYDSLTLNDGYGIDGFKSSQLAGDSRFLLKLQTQSYAPWNLIGFRFGPYFNYSMGVLGSNGSGFKNKKVYSQIGFGILIKNENLIISTFQFSISFYPNMPGNGCNVFKTNSFKTADFGFQSFDIGKPATKVFQ